MPGLLDGRVAVVTGAGRGLGRAEALALAAQGAKVVVNDVGCAKDGTGYSNAPAEQVVAEIRKRGAEAMANYDSVATWEGAASIVKAALDSFNRIDILVNNAGIDQQSMIFNMTPEEWDAVVRVHLYGTFYCTRHASVQMRQQRYGRIINTSSHAALGSIGLSNYSAAKEGIVGLTRAVACELGRYGITCNVIRPTAGTRGNVSESTKKALVKTWGKEQGAKLFSTMEQLTPEGVAPLVVYLASQEADHVNGCVFEVWHGHIGIYDDPPEVQQVLWKSGNWLPEELVDIMPKTLTCGKRRELPPAFVPKAFAP